MTKKLEELLKKFLDSLPELFLIGDPSDWTVVYLNKSMAQSIGKTKEEIIGRKIDNFFPSKILKIRKKYAELAVSTGKPVYFKDKRNNRWFDNTFYPIVISKKKVFVCAFNRDITAQKKLEESKIETEEKFKNLAEQSPSMIYINQMGKIVYVNKICEKIMGYSKKEFYSKDFDFLNLIAPEYKEMVKENFKKHLKGKDVPTIQYALITKNGKKIDAINSTKLIKYNGKPAILGVITDITRYKKIEENIKQIKDYLQNVIDSTSEFVFAVDNNLNISIWNKTAELISGYKRQEVIGKSIKSLKLFDNLDSIDLCLKYIFNNKKSANTELIIKTKNDFKKLLQVSCSVIKGETEEKKGYLLIGRDITLEKEEHGKLLPGNSYLINDKTNDYAISLFKYFAISGYNGLFITRENPENIKNAIKEIENIKVLIFSQENIVDFDLVKNLDELITKINSFTEKSNPIILLDRIDYLISSFSFEAVIKALYKINDIISMKKAILLIRLNPSVVNPNQLAIFEEELNPLPNQKIDTVELDENLFEILKFIDEQKKLNLFVSFKKISQKFFISKVTTAKRLNLLEQKGLIFIKKNGKIKNIYTTEKGRILLNKMRMI